MKQDFLISVSLFKKITLPKETSLTTFKSTFYENQILFLILLQILI